MTGRLIVTVHAIGRTVWDGILDVLVRLLNLRFGASRTPHPTTNIKI